MTAQHESWAIDAKSPLLFGLSGDGGRFEPIGFVYGPSFPERSEVGQKALRRAQLAAAAPDLLKACQQALYALKGREHDQFLRDAIAKATGSAA